MNVLKKTTIVFLLSLSVFMIGVADARCVSMCGYSSDKYGGIDRVYICDENGEVCRIVYAQK